MGLSMYQAGVEPVLHQLKALAAMLDKAEAHCTAKKIDPLAITKFRLRPDMLPFSSQIQIASDMAKSMVSRLAGADVPSYPDTETTFPELKARVTKTIEHVQSFTAAQIDGSEQRDIAFKAGPSELKFKGAGYVTSWVLPNFYFHVTTAYAILRHCGVELGKRDFLGMS